MKSGTLWESTTRRTREALDAGVLQPIPTRWKLVEQDGVGFLVRIVSNLERKAASGVADLSETHLCLLNRFNVIDHHLLIVTRSFEEQEAPLTRADFEALWIGMAEFDERHGPMSLLRTVAPEWSEG
jgi:ATP adenylyltransferase